MTTRTPTPPPLDDDLEALLRRMRLPHMRRTAPEVLATARAQRPNHFELGSFTFPLRRLVAHVGTWPVSVS